ncbi:TPA: YdcF family protein [Vibrio cholerae]|uniref:YdcF family protein n=1 Tax=Vibrio cholerae TaxID=666 RepID=UPI001C4EF4D4|nr:YdcF family protein [Vibrio cholerae]
MSAVCPIYVVLGKRLNANQLTLEGKSRVDGLISALRCHENTAARVVFCGGITLGQTVSEAKRMHEYFEQRRQQLGLSFPQIDVLLEQESTSTVENIEHVAQVLLESGVVQRGETLALTLVSNDYHLKRIFEIQQLMDEQGLLRKLVDRCAQSGVRLEIARDLKAHLCVPYPHQNPQGLRFLWVDELTTYRVFLEGVVANAFQRSLTQVQQQPYWIAQKAIAELRHTMSEEPKLLSLLDVIETVVESTVYQIQHGQVSHEQVSHEQVNHSLAVNHSTMDSQIDKQSFCEALAILDSELTLLNRLCDPELERSGRWWKR